MGRAAPDTDTAVLNTAMVCLLCSYHAVLTRGSPGLGAAVRVVGGYGVYGSFGGSLWGLGAWRL